MPTPGHCSGLNPQILLQRLHIRLKCFDTFVSDFTGGLRIVVFELFDHIDITHFFQFLNLHTQVTGGAVGFSLMKVNSASLTLISKLITASRNCECNMGSSSLNIQAFLLQVFHS